MDPAGEATRSATKRLGIDGVTQLRIGKSIELEIEAANKEDARSKIELMSDRLLANPVIEDWALEFNLKDHIKPDAKILLIKLRSIGDVVYNTAVYGPIKKHLPNARLTVLVEAPSYHIVKNHPDVDEVLCFKKHLFLSKLNFI